MALQEKNLLKASLIITCLGLLTLFLYTQGFNYLPEEPINTLNPQETAKASGRIAKLTQSGTIYFLSVEGKRIETTDVILFPDEEIFLKENQTVEIEGMVEEYQGKKEIIASKIIVK